MHGYIIPSQSPAHRLACVALYRGLLKQTSRLVDPAIRTPVTDHIKRRFKLDKRIQSSTVIYNALSLGRQFYGTIHDAANGSASAQTQIQATLDAVQIHTANLKALRTHQNQLRRPTSPEKLAKIAHLERHRQKEWAKRIPNPIPILQRPVPQSQLPNPDRPRVVPKLVSCHGIPFLRYGSGSQSSVLSRIIRTKHRRDQRRWDDVARLKNEFDHAQLEDVWDRAVAMHTGFRDEMMEAESTGSSGASHDSRGVLHSWTADVQLAMDEVKARLDELDMEEKAKARQMFEIVQQEKALAKKEREERRLKAKIASGRSGLGELLASNHAYEPFSNG